MELRGVPQTEQGPGITLLLVTSHTLATHRCTGHTRHSTFDAELTQKYGKQGRLNEAFARTGTHTGTAEMITREHRESILCRFALFSLQQEPNLLFGRGQEILFKNVKLADEKMKWENAFVYI